MERSAVVGLLCSSAARASGREKRVRARTLTIAASAATLVAAVAGLHAPGAAAAAVQPACASVHAVPVIGRGDPPSTYFRLRVVAGRTVHREIVITNPTQYPCPVAVQPAYGGTAAVSGATYTVTGGTAQTCLHTSCWLSGLPAEVVIPSHSHSEVAFDVHVPSGTGAGEYLAALVTGPASSPPKAGSTAAAAPSAGSVGMDVAILVPGHLTPSVSIPNVTLSGPSRKALAITIRNAGNTWEQPSGTALVEFGGVTHHYHFAASTILPGQQATLPLAIAGIPAGAYPAEVELFYDHNLRMATWLGAIGNQVAAVATTARAPSPTASTPASTSTSPGPTATAASTSTPATTSTPASTSTSPGPTATTVAVPTAPATTTSGPARLIPVALLGLGGLAIIVLAFKLLIVRPRRRREAQPTAAAGIVLRPVHEPRDRR
jgi:hypothetical protein